MQNLPALSEPLGLLPEVVNAALLQREGELGIVRPGALADLLVVDGDPLTDLGLLARQGEALALVMRGASVIHPRSI